MTPYYEDAWTTIYHGEACATLHQLPEASVDVLLTDPPYSSGGAFRGDRIADPSDKYSASWVIDPLAYGTFGGDNRDQRAFAAWVSAWSWQALRLTKPGGHAFCFSDWRQLPITTDAVQLGGWTWRGILAWDKVTTRPIPGRFYNTLEFITWATHGPAAKATTATPAALIRVPNVRGHEKAHPTQKPVALLKHLLSIVPGEELVMLDPFMGAGSTLVAAKYTGHRAIGVEVEERFCEAAAKRLTQDVFDFGGAA